MTHISICCWKLRPLAAVVSITAAKKEVRRRSIKSKNFVDGACRWWRSGSHKAQDCNPGDAASSVKPEVHGEFFEVTNAMKLRHTQPKVCHLGNVGMFETEVTEGSDLNPNHNVFHNLTM